MSTNPAPNVQLQDNVLKLNIHQPHIPIEVSDTLLTSGFNNGPHITNKSTDHTLSQKNDLS